MPSSQHQGKVIDSPFQFKSFENTLTEGGKPPGRFVGYAPRIIFEGTEPGDEKDLGNGVTLICHI